jgi:hypothetical protein
MEQQVHLQDSNTHLTLVHIVIVRSTALVKVELLCYNILLFHACHSAMEIYMHRYLSTNDWLFLV